MASSSNPSSQSTASSDVSMEFSLIPPHRSSYLSPELKVLDDQVFEQIPQIPHFLPLSNFSEKIKQGIKLGLDLSFVRFVQKLQNSDDPSIFLDQLENHTTELDDFEHMGYEVTKLRVRLNVLREKAEQDLLLRLQIDELEEEATEKAAKAKIEEIRVVEMEKVKLMEDATRNSIEFKKSSKIIK
ncbi:DUF724 domain-containing protein 5-like [Papaver somniferum]|uniref:DUF724 domain-containing protein 5-like n=1 Tax=Papaver somniferum TaxID=3469 RepID=UPI000E6F4A46|nr:DUF724 domain-containing protein 5-like [Papaver somniferum]